MNSNHKVLMALMGMEIGGAETHVLELCKTLKAKGLDVHVVSNGGVYVRELEECGIRHYQVPLHNKQALNMLTAYRALKRIIIENDIRLVHSHARIPSFLCGILQKKLKFRFVTTAHADFSLLFFFKQLTNWGERTLAVSDDIKENLLANYRKVNPSNLSLTVNGIDMERFKPGLDFSPLLAELGLERDTLKIVCASRMDRARFGGLAAQTLIAVAGSVPANAQVVLVGGGPDEAAFRAQAEKANEKLGRQAVTMAGQRTDVNLFMAMADISVNVSRSALEAMSACVPVILGGDQGYIGIFDESKLQTAMDTNFTCRGCGALTAEGLVRDLQTLLEMTESERAALGGYGQSVVRGHFSLSRMADDAVAMYDRVTASPVNGEVVISGYYGYNNSGDDIMLASIVTNLRVHRPGVSITVLSKRPGETRAQYGVNAVHRFNFFAVYLRLRKARLLVTGGGNLLQDETSTQSLLYYLWVINTARRRHVKNMLYAKGIGPVSKPVNITRVRNALNKVDLITLREDESIQVLRDIGVTAPQTYVTADAAFALPPAKDEKAAAALQALQVNGPYFCVSLRGWAHMPAQLEPQVAAFADYITTRYGYRAVFVPMLAKEDADISRRVMGMMKGPAVLLPPTQRDNDVIRAIVGNGEFVLGMRLHSLVYALEKGVPMIGLVYSAKVRQYMEYMGQPWHMSLDRVTSDRLKACADEILANKESITEKVRAAGKEAREKAALNAKLCVGLLSGVEL
jgi:polysaccharide pyruvyl transferase CsaB